MNLLQRTSLFALYCAAVSLAQWRVLTAWYEYSRNDGTASHLILIPLVTLGLLALDRTTIFRNLSFAWREGVAVIGAGIALSLTSTSLVPAVAAMAILWIGGFILCFGRSVTRAALFPLGFLLFMIPIPQAVLNASVEFLKNGSTEVTDALFRLTNTTFYREGYLFALPTVTIEIADECSGIRSSIGLVLTALLAGYSYLRTAWANVALLLFIIPLSIAKNAIRIVTLTLLSIHVDPGYLEGQLHHEGGIVFFGISLVLMAPMLLLLRRWERPRTTPERPVSAASA